MSHHRWDCAARMRAGGFRVTPQRQLVLDAVCESGGHASPEVIYSRVRARMPAVNRATVYRALDVLCRLKMVVAAEVDGHRVYEIAGDEPHHHLTCRCCGRTEDLDHAVVDAFLARIARERHFTVEAPHLVLSGICGRCSGGKSTGKTRAKAAPPNSTSAAA